MNKNNDNYIGDNYIGATDTTEYLQVNADSVLRVTVVNSSEEPDATCLKISGDSTVMFRDEEVTIDSLFKYIEDLECRLTDAMFTSDSDRM